MSTLGSRCHGPGLTVSMMLQDGPSGGEGRTRGRRDEVTPDARGHRRTELQTHLNDHAMTATSGAGR